MLRTSLIREGKVIAEQSALNESAVLGGPPYRILEIDLYADGNLASQKGPMLAIIVSFWASLARGSSRPTPRS